MSNPWLNVPLAEYEGHMSAATVRQLDALSDLFADALARTRPASVAILGIAGGNGLEHIDPSVTTRVAGLDCNPLYLEAVRRRHATRCNLTLHCVDLETDRPDLEPVDLVHAALVFEHAGAGRCFETAVSLVRPGGALAVVLQLPSDHGHDVAPTGFASIQSLKDKFELIDPGALRLRLEQSGLRLAHERHRPVPGGKRLWMGVFEEDRPSGRQ
ncbi:MAG: methyltransferase domain-containing protein [Bryobacteraceae bacterium]